VVGEVLEHLRGDDAVEAVVGEREAVGVAPHAGAVDPVGDLPRLVHRAHRRVDRHELVVGVVERDDVGTATQRLEGVTAEATTEVEQAFAGLEAEQVVVGGEHQRPPVVVRAEWSASRARYCSTVAMAVWRQLHRSMTRWRPAAPMRARASGSSRAAPMRAASAAESPGVTEKHVSPSRPVTSGSAPPVVATRGTPALIASMAGRENPS